MTRNDEVKEFITLHPGSTRAMIRKHLPHITHEHELLTRFIESGDGYRERVGGCDKRGCWGYFSN